MKITVEFRGDPRENISTKEMVNFRGVSKNDMTPYLETAV